MQKMKSLIAIALLGFTAHGFAAEKTCVEKFMSEQPAPEYTIADKVDGKVDENEASLFTKGTFSVNPFASARIVDSRGNYGAGLAASYAVTERLTVEADVVTEDVDDSNWSDTAKAAGAGLKLYIPLNTTGFAPYLICGYQRDLVDHENRLQAGAGIEYRLKRLLKRATIFADAQLNHGFEQEISQLGNDVRIRAGLGYRF